jgi:hypothetical protein
MLAQLPTTTAGELGTLVTGLAGLVVIVVGLLTIAVLCRQLFWPQKPTEQWAATRGELAMLEKSVTGNETLIKSETSRLEKSVAALDEYTHQRTHDIANAVHALQLRLEVVRIEMRTDAEALTHGVDGPRAGHPRRPHAARPHSPHRTRTPGRNAMNPAAPGWKTSELYKSLIPQVLAALVLLHVLTAGDAGTLGTALTQAVEAVAALVTSSVAVWKYIEGRTRVKESALAAESTAQAVIGLREGT